MSSPSTTGPVPSKPVPPINVSARLNLEEQGRRWGGGSNLSDPVMQLTEMIRWGEVGCFSAFIINVWELHYVIWLYDDMWWKNTFILSISWKFNWPFSWQNLSPGGNTPHIPYKSSRQGSFICISYFNKSIQSAFHITLKALRRHIKNDIKYKEDIKELWE